MGTLMRIKLYAANQTEAQAAFRCAFSRIAEIDAALTDYRPDSELNIACRKAVGRWVHVSDDLYTVLSKAQEIARATDGAFDVTIGPVTHLWRSARKSGSLPDAAALHAASLLCGFRMLHLDDATHSVRLDRRGMQIDLGGIAKGYAADEALTAFRKQGIRSALVAASGDLTFSAPPPGEEGWKIGVGSKAGGDAGFTRLLTLANAAVSTSGDKEQHLDSDSRRYSHVIDTRTEQGLTSGLTVTVVARHGIDADANATAVDVLGAQAGLAYIDRNPNLSALLLRQNQQGQPVLMSKRFQLLTAERRGID